MKPIEIEFEKLELGTLFFDPITGMQYRKVSEDKAEVEVEDEFRIMDAQSTLGEFEPNEVVIV